MSYIPVKRDCSEATVAWRSAMADCKAALAFKRSVDNLDCANRVKTLKKKLVLAF